MRYIAGTNQPGHMPDNTPDVFDDFDSAKRSIIGELKQREDDAETEDEAEQLCAFAEDVNLQSGEFSATCCGWVYWVTKE